MGFLLGIIILGITCFIDEGLFSASEVAVQSATALLLLMQKRVQTLLLQAEMSKSLRMPKKNSKDFTE